MTTTYDQAEIDAMRDALDRAQKAKFLWASLNKEMRQRGVTPDYALANSLQGVVDEATGCDGADTALLEEAEAAREVARMVRTEVGVLKAELAAQQASLESSVPDGYQSIGTDATPVYISLRIELSLNQPLSPHIVVPPAEPKTKTITQGFDQHGEPQVTITSE